MSDSVPDPDGTAAPARLFQLLPAHLRARDAAAGDDQPGGPLAALLQAVCGELEVLEADIEGLYDNWFIETCADWVLPYLADLVGLEHLPADLGPGVSARRLVANTVAYRRRKGTPAVLEQVARDVTGWPARTVEFFQLLATTTHLNHVRLDRPTTADLRRADTLQLVGNFAGGALDSVAHTPDVRTLSSGRGRYGIANMAVFLFPLQTYEVTWARASHRGEGTYAADPLGRTTPLFAAHRTDPVIEHLAQEADLPLPLRPHRLLQLLQAARNALIPDDDLPIGVRIGTQGRPLPPGRIRVCGLEDLDPHETEPQVMIDPVGGSLKVYQLGRQVTPEQLFVRYRYGAVANVGAGPYNRRQIHDHSLCTDNFLGAPHVAGQIAVRSGAPPSAGTVGSLGAALQAAGHAWTGSAGPAGGTYFVIVTDSATYTEDLKVAIPAGARLVIVAAAAPPGSPLLAGTYITDGLRPHLLGNLHVTGDQTSSLIIDGLLVEGRVSVGAGLLSALTVSQCTVTNGVTAGTRLDVEEDEERDTASVRQDANRGLNIRLVRSIVGAVTLADTVPSLAVADSVLDPSLPMRSNAGTAGAAAVAVAAAGAALTVEGSTVLGEVTVRRLEASSAILAGRTTVQHRHTGCVRYCFVAPGSRIPKHFRSVLPGDEAAPQPVFASLDPGSPHYAALARSCPQEIAEGSEGEAEMGVHHHLRRPQRIRAARLHIAPYVPTALEITIIGG
ncbi:phage tail protein [Catellatospora chokoriensis]|uniref:Phage tail protein (Tail_P2_I) n=1 Tax=Catellatospora chokoriensis TaxID=310353 RepID=A0A8J3K8E2_9ACTN|nr:phage tail protein [Catellatospora chokoriensis]GIF90384.1 hypothetical protein Cch02nite_38280 [Catellatospora chokoriensis]